jgi:hypothetical protein
MFAGKGIRHRKGVKDLDPHEEIVQQKKLPQVGQTVRSKEHGTLWKVMEKRQIYDHSAGDAVMGDFHLVPAIYLIYWKIEKGKTQGIGKLLGYSYSLHDNTFESNWEIVS